MKTEIEKANRSNGPPVVYWNLQYFRFLCLFGLIRLELVALNYGTVGVAGFQKNNGKHSLASRLMMAPYFVGVWINSRAWTRNAPEPNVIADDVWLGRMPSRGEWSNMPFSAVVDLTCEMECAAPREKALHYHCVPLLDLTVPAEAFLQTAAETIERAREQGTLLVCCALGYSRSASAVAAWLLHTHRAATVEQAIDQIRRARPSIVLTEAHRAALHNFAAARG